MVKLRDWKESIAAAGVILSLIFVGYEVRQNTKVARGQARQALAELNQEWLILLSQDPEFNRIFQKVWSTQDELTESEWSRGSFMMTMHLRRLENVFFQYDEGLIDQSALNSYGLQMVAENLNSERFRRYWIGDKWRNGFDPKFVNFLEGKAGF